MVKGNYNITSQSGRFELFRTTEPGFRAEVDLGKPHPVIKNIQWLDPDITTTDKDRCINEAYEYLDLFVLMGE